MTNPIISPKKSTIAGRVPTANDLAPGEICINHADAKLYAKHPSSGEIQEIGSLTAHSHDQLISVDSTADLELQNNGSVIITDGAISTTLALSSTTARTITFPNKTGTLAIDSEKISKDASDATPVNTIRVITQAEYDGIVPKDANTLYFIKS